ncbi:MAG TPA: SDR family oxidoreductase [Vicinamibacterales bacterium]
MREAFTLVTGASGGIGRAVAAAIAADHRLILCGRSEERLAALRDELGAECHLIWRQDLSDSAAAGSSLAALLADTPAHVEHFVHAAGIFDVRALHMIDWQAAMQMFHVNLFSAIEIVRQLSRKRVNERPLRTATFVSSIASRTAAPGYHLYAATKGALNALARSLAVELAPEVRVNCVLPGPIETESTRAVLARMDANIPLGAGKASDVAMAVRFVMSDDARWITGQEIVVDGGRSIV